MEKVFLVLCEDNDSSEVCGIYSTIEQAIQRASALTVANNGWYETYRIQEWNVGYNTFLHYYRCDGSLIVHK